VLTSYWASQLLSERASIFAADSRENELSGQGSNKGAAIKAANPCWHWVSQSAFNPKQPKAEKLTANHERHEAQEISLLCCHWSDYASRGRL